MIPRRAVLWFCAAVALVIALLIWFARKPTEVLQPALAESNVAPSSMEHVAAGLIQHRPRRAPPTSEPSAQTVTDATPLAQPTQAKNEQMREGLAALNDEQVVLYGRAIDQFESPVPGATVVANIQLNNGTRVGTDKFSLTTDANGSFTVSGYKGKALGINITKPGYALATANTRFVYSLLWPEAERHLPDPSKPVIFKMWKLQGSEPLIQISQRYKVDYTTSPISFDLLVGTIVPTGGDIRLTVNRSPGVVSERTLQDWGVQIEAVNGGLIRTSLGEARVTYQAPESGYQPNDAFVMSTNPPHKWFGGVDQVYFVRSRGGQVYCRVNFGIGINQQPGDKMEVEFRGVANANGSRNWEATAFQQH